MHIYKYGFLDIPHVSFYGAAHSTLMKGSGEAYFFPIFKLFEQANSPSTFSYP